MANSKKASVLVVDAEPVARYGLVQLINAHAALRVAGEADNLRAARELALRLKPEVVVLDPAMGDGLHFVKELARCGAHSRVVAFTSLDDAVSVQRAFKAGVCSYLTRQDSIVVLLAAIIGAVVGVRHVGPRVERVLLEQLASGAVQFSEDQTSVLSPRERQVFQMLGAGKSARVIAGDLGVSAKTIETHRQRIKQKLHIENGAELHRRAFLATNGNGR